MAYGTTAGVAARIPGIGASVLSTPDTDQIAVAHLEAFDGEERGGGVWRGHAWPPAIWRAWRRPR